MQGNEIRNGTNTATIDPKTKEKWNKRSSFEQMEFKVNDDVLGRFKKVNVGKVKTLRMTQRLEL